MPTVESSPPRRARIVDALVVHGAPIDFRELCLRAIPTGARTLLLDLDRTVHLGRNMGELLGWEICAHLGYGPERLAALDRGPGRVALDWSSPAALLRYLSLSARMWAMPGLHYLVWGKIAWHSPALRRLSFHALGPEPVRAAQRVPQTALMHHMAELPLATLRDLAASVWRRHEPEQVILREDIAWLRRRCPSLRIVLTSASPQPVVEVAAEELGVDDAVYSSIEEEGGWLSAPAQRARVFSPAPAPRRISPPAAVRINASHAKIAEITRRSPDALSAPADTVGITDTGYGEDHCWAEHLGHVIDVNSTAPFPPIVGASSPLRSIHSAALLTRDERARPGRLDPRRGATSDRGPVVLGEAELAPALGGTLLHVESLMARFAEAERACADERAVAERALAAIEMRAAILVDAYNRGAAGERPGALGRLGVIAAEERRARRDLARAQRPVGAIAHAVGEALGVARSQVDELIAAPPAARSPSLLSPAT